MCLKFLEYMSKVGGCKCQTVETRQDLKDKEVDKKNLKYSTITMLQKGKKNRQRKVSRESSFKLEVCTNDNVVAFTMLNYFPLTDYRGVEIIGVI